MHLRRVANDDGEWAVVHVSDSGLGLPIARGYAQAHGGDLRFCDEDVVPGAPQGRVGAAFVIVLPSTIRAPELAGTDVRPSSEFDETVTARSVR